MIIHVVQQGETIDSIAQMYGIDEVRLIKENGLADQNKLAVGQTILIVHAKQVHTVKEGDTLQSIADQYGITLIQLLRNNSYLLDREFIYPGEMIVIDFEDEKITKIATNGYVFPYVEPKILEKNLLYMTYLSIYSYTISSNGKLNDIDDANIISMAKSYGVAPIMVISNIKEADYEDKELAHNILNNQEIKNNLIENALSVLKKKGYYAVNVNIPYVQTADINLFIEFTLEFAERLHKEGFKAFITITPKTFELHPGKVHEEVDYSRIGQNIDGLVLISYDWAYPSDISAETIPFYYVKNLVEIFSSKISPEKIFIGYTTIGYIYEMPYIEGDSKARAISYVNAVLLASEANATIQFNSVNLSSYFYLKNQDYYMVIFHDARGLNTFIQMIPEFGLQGLAIWNAMYYLPQTFLLINTQYDIETIKQ